MKITANGKKAKAKKKTIKKEYVRFRSSRSEVFCKKGVNRNSAKFTGKYMCQSLFLNKVIGHCLFLNKKGTPRVAAFDGYSCIFMLDILNNHNQYLKFCSAEFYVTS